MKFADDTISRVASLMGKRGWKARVEKYGKKALQERMREIGRRATGRPRLPDSKVKPASLYQRERRARLRAEAKLKKGEKQHGKSR
jgi:hypothetical protein